MITVKGKTYPTIADAAYELGVSAKTVREYIRKRIIEEPPKVQYGLRLVWHFPPQYLRKAKKQIAEYVNGRENKRESGKSSGKGN